MTKKSHTQIAMDFFTLIRRFELLDRPRRVEAFSHLLDKAKILDDNF